MFRLFNIIRSVNGAMSSLTVTVTGTNPAALTCDFFPPHELTEGDWYAGLLDFTTYNSIPNVVEGKNNVFPVLLGNEWQSIRIPTGAYENEDIGTYLKKAVGTDRALSLRPNNNTVKCKLFCSYDVDFTRSEHSISPMLGSLCYCTLHTSDAAVNIIKVNNVAIRCSIVHGSYKD